MGTLGGQGGHSGEVWALGTLGVMRILGKYDGHPRRP